MIETMADLGGQPLEPAESFTFACEPALACFGSCCRDKRLPVTPYDALRLGRGLGISAAELLAEHLELEMDPRSGWPALRIKLADGGACPYLTSRGCRVYQDRPTCCRIYPVVRAVKPGRDHRGVREVFLRQDTPHCLGWDQPRRLTPAQWVADQGLAPYHRHNDRLLSLVMHPKRRGKVELSPRQTHAFIAALYNREVLAQMLSDPGFVQRYRLEAGQVARALADEEELIGLGIDWLADQLFGPA